MVISNICRTHVYEIAIVPTTFRNMYFMYDDVIQAKVNQPKKLKFFNIKDLKNVSQKFFRISKKWNTTGRIAYYG